MNVLLGGPHPNKTYETNPLERPTAGTGLAQDRETSGQSHAEDKVAGAVWDQVSGLTPKGIKRMIISIVDADGERIITSHTAHSTPLYSSPNRICRSVPCHASLPPW